MILYFKKKKSPLKGITKNTYKRIDPVTNKFSKMDTGYYFLEEIKEERDCLRIPYIFYSYKWYEDIASFKKEKIEKIEIL